MNDLSDWLAGYANPPVHVFLQAVDIIEAHAEAQADNVTGAPPGFAARRPSAA